MGNPMNPMDIANITIELEKKISGNMVMMTPVVSNLPEGHYRYQMNLVKEGKSGRSSNAQSGNFSVVGNADRKLSTTGISLAPEDICELTVSVAQGNDRVLEKRFQCRSE